MATPDKYLSVSDYVARSSGLKNIDNELLSMPAELYLRQILTNFYLFFFSLVHSVGNLQ